MSPFSLQQGLGRPSELSDPSKTTMLPIPLTTSPAPKTNFLGGVSLPPLPPPNTTYCHTAVALLCPAGSSVIIQNLTSCGTVHLLIQLIPLPLPGHPHLSPSTVPSGG